MEMKATRWADSTQSKIESFLDDYLIDFPQGNVRKSTQRLLYSLYAKGTERQRQRMLRLFGERVCRLASMGHSSQEFLELLNNILKRFPEEYVVEKKQIILGVLQVSNGVFGKIHQHPDYSFYALCSNMIESSGNFKPYLLEANGCWKCCSKPIYDFQTAQLFTLKDQIRMHLDQAEFILRRRYQIKALKIQQAKKKIPNLKSIHLSYRDNNGVKIALGSYSPNEPIQVPTITTSSIIIRFELVKNRRHEIQCFSCNSSEQFSHVCANCLKNCIEIEGSFKVVGGNPEKISRELCDSYRNLNGLRRQLEQMWNCIQSASKLTPIKQKIVTEMNSIYMNIIENIGLLNTDQNGVKAEAYMHCVADCYSCHFAEFQAVIVFFEDILSTVVFTPEELALLLIQFRKYNQINKLHALQQKINGIISKLILNLTSNNPASLSAYQVVTESNHSNVAAVIARLVSLVRSSKPPLLSIMELVKEYVMAAQNMVHWDVTDRILLLVAFNNEDQVSEGDPKRVSSEVFAQYARLANFNISHLLTMPITDEIRMFLRLIPEQLVPRAQFSITDSEYLKYTVNRIPEITDAYIQLNIVYCPQPTLKLNIFKILPELIKSVSLQEAMDTIVRLFKYKPIWNLNIKEAVDNFDRMLGEVDKKTKLMLCLQGYDKSEQDIYFEHIYRILTPQRPSFIIRLEVPQGELSKEQRHKGALEYIYLPVQEIKSEDLKGDTIGALHDWVTNQLTKLDQLMIFDLIVEKNIIDNLDLSLEIVYRKMVEKPVQRKIGNKVYEFFKVIYRIQGLLGEAVERVSANPRDDKLEECITYSSHLLTKIDERKCGLDVLMRILPTIRKQDFQKRDMTLRILEMIFKNDAIIKQIVKLNYGDGVINLAVRYLSLNKADIKTTSILLEMCSKIIDEANTAIMNIRKKSQFVECHTNLMQMEDEMELVDSEQSVRFVLEKVKEAEDNNLKNFASKLIKILPFCSKDNMATSKYLFDFFEVKRYLQIKYSQKIGWLVQFVQALSENYTSFKSICEEQGVTESIVDVILEELNRQEPVVDCLQLALTLLKGLVQGDKSLQEDLFSKGIIHHIYRLGTVTPEAKDKLGKVPLVCFQLNKYFTEGKNINDSVLKYYREHEAQKKRIVEQQKAKKREIINKKKSKAFELYGSQFETQENESVFCLSCKEGYLKSKQILGVYIYSSKWQIPTMQSWYKESKKMMSITSTSYFTAIHIECHIHALKDDQKIHKQEWEGALIRNGDVLCNNWLALKGPKTTDEEFDQVHKKYFQRNGKNGNYWIVLNDLNGLLTRFSQEYDFALETKGSSFTHNSKLMLLLISYTAHLMKSTEDIKHIKEGVIYLESNPPKKSSLLNLLFCSSIFLYKAENYENKKKAMYVRMTEIIGGKEMRQCLIYLSLVTDIVRMLNRGAIEDKHIPNWLCVFITEKFNDLLVEFEKVGDNYRNVIVKMETPEEFKKYMSVS